MAFALVTASLLALSLVVCTLLHAESQASHARSRLYELRTVARRPVPAPAVNAEKSGAAPALPWFQSAQLVEQLGNAAADSGLALDEVGYVLEEGANRPYLRYRVTLTVAASYPAIRRFATNVTATWPHVGLDSINCKRSDIQVAPLSCDLAFSAFFRKDGHG